VLKSNANSKVFINFADHGAPGLIAFPSEYLYADDFNNAINYMHDNSMYDKMVIYIEACESGSMFDGILKDNINVYATTAANS
jgi:legumain